eukprot:Blabericola_migrator_1__3394@NODE_1_length_33786_cov_123_788665_g0_i0_p16_GENE_NODE_1_length_33786_cov_123_788665_g0_i0NODE_1_length_33786_cov_123_788665_g0_i0_p16_ORF_typecomplete_len225_score34_55tRNAsynt_1f/PF01921_18/0_06Mod_r/PF07200_13/0_066PASTA/PF03793_19/0_2PASTA/PF03793_19/8_7e03_NODE_1_length_33786_cov_123_788665_g0_i085849258
MGIVVDIQPRLSEPSFIEEEEVFSPEVVQGTFAWSGRDDIDELEKAAVQGSFVLPEPLLARALALEAVLHSNETDAETIRVEYHESSRRMLEEAASVLEQQTLIAQLLNEISGEDTESEVVEENTVLSVTPYTNVTANAVNATSSNVTYETLVEAFGLNGTTSTTTASVNMIANLNEVLSNLNQAMGGSTTTTPSPQVAIVRGIDNFVQVLNVLALQLASNKET